MFYFGFLGVILFGFCLHDINSEYDDINAEENNSEEDF